MEYDRNEAVTNYDRACSQLNVLVATSAVALSIIVSTTIGVTDHFSKIIFAISCGLITVSLVIASYHSLKSRRVISIYNHLNAALVKSDDQRQMMVASINTTLMITKSHTEASETKRKILNRALITFIVGIITLIVGISVTFV